MHLSTVLCGTLVMALGASVASGDDLERLNDSRVKWEARRDALGGDYSYQVLQVYYSGTRQTTTVVVKANQVVERRLEAIDRPQPPKPGEPAPGPVVRWVETGKELGTHPHAGVAAVTVDELYAEAKRVLSAPVPEFHKRQLAFDSQGFLSHCFVVDTRIADDAPVKGVQPFKLVTAKP